MRWIAGLVRSWLSMRRQWHIAVAAREAERDARAFMWARDYFDDREA